MKKIILFFLLNYLLLTSVWADLCTSSQACYRMTEGSGTTTADNSGNGNTGSFASSGHPAWQSGGPSFSVSGSAANNLLFASSSDLLTITAASGINTLGPITVTAWIKASGDGGGGLGRIMDKSGGGSNGWMFYDGGTQSITFQVNYTTTNLVRHTNASTFTLNSWHFIVATWDGSTTATNIHVYIDNVEPAYQTTTNASGSRQTDTQNIIMGNNAGGTRNFGGAIYGCAIYNTVLSSTDLTSLYNYGPTGTAGSSSSTATISNAIISNATIY